MPFILGTAGHIDHGKTTLIRALTGQETDRLPEEQERGISIDLGFAHFDGPEGTLAGVVDVPGHERFIRNMLAGAQGIDIVLFTVAADDGIMPQSEEHLDILHLLGVRRGIFVITKCDLVDAARVASVREEIEILALDTTLEGAPILEVSVVTGAGLASLREEIHRQLAAPPDPPPAGPFRLPVDRAFVMHGHGVVVTGTAAAGAVAEGDAVRILPGGEEARVRSVEVHGQPTPRARHGQRVAINLGGIERADIRRGHVVCDARLDRTTDRFDAWVEVRPGARLSLRHHGRVRVHIGTAEVLGKTILLDGRGLLAPRGDGYVQLVLAEPVVALRGDRFILRDETARWTLGGGEVIHPFAVRHRVGAGTVTSLAILRGEAVAPAAREVVVRDDAFAVDRAVIALALNRDDAEIATALAAVADIVPIPDRATAEAYTTTDRWERLVTTTLAAVAEVHRAQPLLPGVELEPLRTGLPWPVSVKVFRWAIDRLAAEKRLVREDSMVRLPTHRVALGAEARALGERVVERLAAGGFSPPDLRQLEEALGIPQKRLADVLSVLDKEKRVVRVAADLFYAPAAAEQALARLRDHCQTHGEITAAVFRDLIGASRKFAIAFLDWTDRTGVTVRIGDARKLRR